jgi:hypothetical protein
VGRPARRRGDAVTGDRHAITGDRHLACPLRLAAADPLVPARRRVSRALCAVTYDRHTRAPVTSAWPSHRVISPHDVTAQMKSMRNHFIVVTIHQYARPAGARPHRTGRPTGLPRLT